MTKNQRRFKADVFAIIRWEHNKVRALLPRLPDRHAGLHAERLCVVIRGQDDAVPRLLIAADDNGLVAQLGAPLHLDRRVKAVGVHMKDIPTQTSPPPAA